MKVLVVCGTRPDAIKLAPIYRALQKHLTSSQLRLVSTGQHRELLDQVLSELELTPHVDLAVMRPGQDLTQLAARIVAGIGDVLTREAPTLVVTHGDTTTAFAASLASFYQGIPVAHVEAGLRSFAIESPFPEEAHRRFITTMAAVHFAPTIAERRNLLREGVPHERIHVTGNTLVDALAAALTTETLAPQAAPAPSASRQLLLTMHRRERTRSETRALLASLRTYLDAHPELTLTCPLHLRAETRDELSAVLGDHPRVVLTPPLRYTRFIALLRDAACVLTDSGGVQEEAALLRKPVLLLRDRTERRDGIASGRIRLVGSDPALLPVILNELMQAPTEEPAPVVAQGSPARRIAELIVARRAA